MHTLHRFLAYLNLYPFCSVTTWIWNGLGMGFLQFDLHSAYSSWQKLLKRCQMNRWPLVNNRFWALTGAIQTHFGFEPPALRWQYAYVCCPVGIWTTAPVSSFLQTGKFNFCLWKQSPQHDATTIILHCGHGVLIVMNSVGFCKLYFFRAVLYIFMA